MVVKSPLGSCGDVITVVKLTHHCHCTMASADSKFDDFCLQCIQFGYQGKDPGNEVDNKNVNALIARELSGFTFTRSLTMNSKFSIPNSSR